VTAHATAAVITRRFSWWPIELYPAAFPLSLVVLVWGQAEINLMELVRPALVAVAASLLITLLLSILARDRLVGGMAAAATTLALVVDRPTATLALVGVAVFLVVLARLTHRRQIRYLPSVTTILRAIAMVTLLAAVIAAVTRPGFVANVEEAFLPPPGPADRPMPPDGSPDIFVYLLDGYPGASAAAQAPSFDATAFPSALRDRGFTVHADSRSNYLLTRLVLPTMFESRHVVDIPELAPPFGPDQAVDARRLRGLLERSSGLAAIRGAGYDVMWISCGASHLDIRTVDRRIEAAGPSELEVVLLRQSGLGTLLQVLDPSGYSQMIRDRMSAALQTAVELAREPHDRPRFVFVHVSLPHPPTVLRADGSPENGSPDATWDGGHRAPETKALRRQRTFEQVAAVGRAAVEGVDALLAAAPRPPVVVMFSDHGTDIQFDPNAALSSDLNERSSNIIAALTPGHPGIFDAPTTPINIIGTLTDAYLGTSVATQPNTTYAYRGSVLDAVPVQVAPGD
jgi:hypothetical protein